MRAVADDTGLEVAALGGAPGVRSARYAGESADDADNRALLLEVLVGVADRSARFRTVAVVVFPEGTRSKSHTLQEGQLGVVYLAMKSQAPILPVGITGTQNMRAWRMPFPMCRLSASIGPPFTLPVLEGRAPRPVMQSMLRMIMERVAMQLPPEFRGVYDPTASQPAVNQEVWSS